MISLLKQKPAVLKQIHVKKLNFIREIFFLEDQ